MTSRNIQLLWIKHGICLLKSQILKVSREITIPLRKQIVFIKTEKTVTIDKQCIQVIKYYSIQRRTNSKYNFLEICMRKISNNDQTDKIFM